VDIAKPSVRLRRTPSSVIPAEAGIQEGGFYANLGIANQAAAKLAMAAWPSEIPPSLHGTSL